MTKKDEILFKDVEIIIPQHVYSILSEVYNSRDRYYHTNNHITKMLNDLEVLVESKNLNIKTATLISIAILFHDVVLFEEDPVSKSAKIAELLLRDILPIDDITKVVQFIMATDYAYIPQNDDELIIRDLDLLILSSDWNEYSEYAKNIELEYGQNIPHEQYVDGRKRVLENILQWQKIYETKYFDYLNEKANANIRRELIELQLTTK